MLQKYAALGQAHAQLCQAAGDPFAVSFDRMLSPTEAMQGDRMVTLFGSNN